MKVWIDVTSLPHVQFFRALIKRLEKAGNDVLVTSREFGIMNDIMEKNGIEYTSIGSHGGIGKKSKLVRSSERILELTELVTKEQPDLGMSKHSVECARVCFGLSIPSVMVIDHETADAAMRLMVPLTDHVVAPLATPAEILKKFGSRNLHQFYGVCEPAHFYDFTPKDDVLSVLGLSKGDKILLARSEPMLSSHNGYESKLLAVLNDIRESYPDVKMVFIPRGKEDMGRFKELDLVVPEESIDTLSLYSYASLMIGAGSCMNREACIGGCPTISICPDRLPAVDKFMISKKMMLHSLEEHEIVSMASGILNNGTLHERRNGKIAEGFEDPYAKIMDIVKSQDKH